MFQVPQPGEVQGRWPLHGEGEVMQKPVWAKPRPKGLGKSTPLTMGQKAKAKAAAKAGGRKYPNLVDNMRAAKGK